MRTYIDTDAHMHIYKYIHSHSHIFIQTHTHAHACMHRHRHTLFLGLPGRPLAVLLLLNNAACAGLRCERGQEQLAISLCPVGSLHPVAGGGMRSSWPFWPEA